MSVRHELPESVRSSGSESFDVHVRSRSHAGATTKPPAARRLLPLGAMLAGMSLHPDAALAQQAADTAKELPAVKVDADASRPDGMRATTTRVGKTLQDPHEIPQAVTTVTKSIMDEQQVGSLREALRNMQTPRFAEALADVENDHHTA